MKYLKASPKSSLPEQRAEGLHANHTCKNINQAKVTGLLLHINHHQRRLDALSGCECMMECENPSSSDSVSLWPLLYCCECPIVSKLLFVFMFSAFSRG